MHYLKSISLIILLTSSFIFAQTSKKTVWTKENFSGLEFRSIGPAFMSGRISDIAFHPDNESVWYVTVGSGNVWKTVNAGVTWTPIFDNQNNFRGTLSISGWKQFFTSKTVSSFYKILLKYKDQIKVLI